MKKKIAIVGAGPGGYAAALRAAQLGAAVTIIEDHQIGGTCLNYGCIPSKIMKHTADIMTHLRNADEIGVSVSGNVCVDLKKLQIRKKNIIDVQAKGMLNNLKHHKVEFVKGQAVFDASLNGAVKIRNGEVDTVRYDKLILSTGSKPFALPELPFDGENIISTNEAFGLKEIPRSLLIIGGGVIGCEFAFIFASLGSTVTLVEKLPRLLPIPSVDEDCSKILQREMKKRKINFFINSSAMDVREKDGKMLVTVVPMEGSGAKNKTKNRQETISVDKIMVCVGRMSSLSGMGVEKTGIAADDNSWVQVDEYMETRMPDVYAIGDMLGPSKIMLAHVASTEGIIAAENAMGKKRKMHYDVVPNAIFTMPEVASVGLTEHQATQKGIKAKSDAVLFRTIGKAHIISEISGQAKIVSNEANGRIIGVHIIGPHATDLIAEGTLAVKSGITVKEMAETIHAHPTLAEIMMEASLKSLE